MHPKRQFLADVHRIYEVAAVVNFDCRELLLPTEPDYEMKMTEEFRRGYMCGRYAVASVFNPKRICELGVCSGIGALSFLAACPEAEYVGVDDLREEKTLGVSLVRRAKELLDSRGYKATIIIEDSGNLTSLPGLFDLIHVDGCHTRKGARHEVQLAWDALNDGGHILVDDCYNTSVVAGVFDTLASISSENICWADMGGNLIIRKEIVM